MWWLSSVAYFLYIPLSFLALDRPRASTLSASRVKYLLMARNQSENQKSRGIRQELIEQNQCCFFPMILKLNLEMDQFHIQVRLVNRILLIIDNQCLDMDQLGLLFRFQVLYLQN